jgi:hypothetical protein
MTLEALGGGGYDFVQDAEPTDANRGDAWLDTSSNPPEVWVYADVGNGTEWLKTEVADYSRRIFEAVERRVSEQWSTAADFDQWSVELGAAAKHDVTGSPSYAYGSSSHDIMAGNSNNREEGVIYFSDPRDMSNYSSIDIDWVNTGSSSDNNKSYISVDTKPPTEYGSAANAERTLTKTSSFSRTVDSLDVSDLYGNYYVAVHARDDYPDATISSELTFYNAGSTFFEEYYALEVSDDSIRYEVGTGGLSARSPIVSPTTMIVRWDIANFRRELDGGEVTVHVEDDSQNVLLSDVQDGEDISDISASQPIRLRVDFNRADTANDPQLIMGAIRWLE